jgi:hypothetical protein
MGKCNALSRQADHANGSDDNCDMTLLQPKFFTVRALKGMMIEGAECDILREVRKGVQDGKSEDAVMLAMKELERSKGRMVQSLEWSQKE